jgi:hypothetical protein
MLQFFFLEFHHLNMPFELKIQRAYSYYVLFKNFFGGQNSKIKVLF